MAVQDPVTPSPEDTTGYDQPALPRFRIVRMPDGKKLRFPGETADSVIKSVSAKYWASKQPGAAAPPAAPPSKAPAAERTPFMHRPGIPISSPLNPQQQVTELGGSYRPPRVIPESLESATAPAEATRVRPHGQYEQPIGPVTQEEATRRHQIAVLRAYPEAAEPGMVGPLTQEQIPFQEAEQRMARFYARPQLEQAGRRLVKGATAVIPSAAGVPAEVRDFTIPNPMFPQGPRVGLPEWWKETPRERAGETPEPKDLGERMLEGAGGAIAFMGEAAALGVAGAGPIVSAVLPAVASEGTFKERALSGVIFGGMSGAAHIAGPIIADLLSNGRGIERSMAEAANEVARRRMAEGVAPSAARAIGERAARDAFERIASQKSGVAELIGKVAPPVLFGGAQPWVQTYAEKQLGNKDAQFPTAREMIEGIALLGGVGLGMARRTRAGQAQVEIQDRERAARAERAMGQKPEIPATREIQGLLPPEKRAGWEAVNKHLSEPYMPNFPLEEQRKIRHESMLASEELRKQLRGQALVFQTRNDQPVVQGKFGYGNVWTIPGETQKVRIVVEDQATGQMVPFSFRDVAEFHRALRRGRRALEAQQPAPPIPARPRVHRPAPPRPSGPLGAPTAPVDVETVKGGFLRLRQSAVAEALLEHARGGKLSPVVAEQLARAKEELKGIVSPAEIEHMYRNSKDAKAFVDILRNTVEERAPGVFPGAAPQPGAATQGGGERAPEGGGTGAAPEVKEEPPPPPNREEITMEEIDDILRDPKYRREFEELSVKGEVSDEEFDALIRRAMAERGIVMKQKEEPPPPPEPEAPPETEAPTGVRPEDLPEGVSPKMLLDYRDKMRAVARKMKGNLLEKELAKAEKMAEHLTRPGMERRPPLGLEDRLAIERYRALMEELDRRTATTINRFAAPGEGGEGKPTARSIEDIRNLLRKRLGIAEKKEEKPGEAPTEKAGPREPAPPARPTGPAQPKEVGVGPGGVGGAGPVPGRRGGAVGAEPRGVEKPGVVPPEPTPPPSGAPDKEYFAAVRLFAERLSHDKLRAEAKRVGDAIHLSKGTPTDVRRLRIYREVLADKLEVGERVRITTTVTGELREGELESIGDDRQFVRVRTYASGAAEGVRQKLAEAEKERDRLEEALATIRGGGENVQISRHETEAELAYVNDQIRQLNEQLRARVSAGIEVAYTEDVEKIAGEGGKPPAPPEAPPDVPAGEWRPTIVEARAEYSNPADVRVIPPEFLPHLRPDQQQATAKMITSMVKHGGGLLASGTGAGKTRIELVVAERLRRLGRTVIIFSPSSVIKQDWDTRAYRGDFAKSSKVLGIDITLWNSKYGIEIEPGKIYLTTPEQLKYVLPNDNYALILDESHFYKNMSSQRTQTMLKLIAKAHSVLTASATPKDKFQNFFYLVKSGILERPGETFPEFVHKMGLELRKAKIKTEIDFDEPIEVGWTVRFSPEAGSKGSGFDGRVLSVEVKNGEAVFTIQEDSGRVHMVTRKMGDFMRIEIADKIMPQDGVSDEEVLRRTEKLFDRMTQAGRMVRHEISLKGVPIEFRVIKTPREVIDSMAELEFELTQGQGVDNQTRMEKADTKMKLRRHLEHLKIAPVVKSAVAEVKKGRQVIIFADIRKAITPNKFEKVFDPFTRTWVKHKIPLEKFKIPGTLPELKRQLEAAGLTVGEVHGGVTKRVQLENIDAFQAGKLDVMVGNPPSMGTGIDLDHQVKEARPRSMYIMTTPFDGMNMSQTIGRAIRGNSISPPTITIVFYDHAIDAWGKDIIDKKLRDLGATVKGEIPVMQTGQKGEGETPVFESRAPQAAVAGAARNAPGLRGGRAPGVRTPTAPHGIPIAGRVPTLPKGRAARALPSAPVPPMARKPGISAATRAKVKEAWNALTAVINPVSLATPRQIAHIMEMKGELDLARFENERKYRYGLMEQAAKAAQGMQDSLHTFWEKLRKDQVMDFWDKIETGWGMTPELADVAKLYRDRADNLFEGIIRWKDVPYYDHWFPHLWTDPAKAAKYFTGRRPMEGTKSFLRKRFFASIREGIEKGRLEPRSWNPEEMMQWAEDNVRRFVGVQEMLRGDPQDPNAPKGQKLIAGVRPKKGLIADKLAIYAPIGSRAGQAKAKGRPAIPDDFVRMDQPWTKVFLPPTIEVSEYLDKAQLDGIRKAIDSLKIKNERVTKGLGRGVLGLSSSPPGGVGWMKTKFATPLSVISHELGHQIDTAFGLEDQFIRHATYSEIQELKRLAELRHYGIQTAKSFKKYVQRPKEKMAVMLEAFMHAPEAFKGVAPLNYEKFKNMLLKHPETAHLASVKPGLVYQKMKNEMSRGGLTQSGDYWIQKDLARLINNHMSQDFLTKEEGFGPWGRGFLKSRNLMNSFELGVSGFHATGITLLSVMSKLQVGLSETVYGAARRDVGLLMSGLGKIAMSPVELANPIGMGSYIRKGWQFYNSSPSLTATEREIFHDMFAAGARLDKGLTGLQYQNNMLDRLVKNFRQARAQGTPFSKASVGHYAKMGALAVPAAMESVMNVLSEVYIPQIKVAAFRDLYSSELRIRAKDLASGKITRQELARQMWNNIENRMGLLNYDNLFWHRGIKTGIMILIRAPGWTLGTLREFGGAAFLDLPRLVGLGKVPGLKKVWGRPGAPPPQFTPRMSFALSMVMTTVFAGAIYHMAHTGEKPRTLEDYLHPKNGAKDENGRDIRVDLPTYFKDVFGWFGGPYTKPDGSIGWRFGDPVKMMLGRKQDYRGVSSLGHGGKLSSLATGIWDLLENQTFRGPMHRPINSMDDWAPAAGDVMKYIMGDVATPIAIQQRAALTRGKATPEEQAEAFLGITRHREPQPQHRRPPRWREPEYP